MFKGNKTHGEGTEVFANGNIYMRYFYKGKRNGIGSKKFAYGDLYEGQQKNDKQHGWGAIKYNGNVYNGKWKDDAKRKGMMKSKIGREYTAEYSYYRLGNMQQNQEDKVQKQAAMKNNRSPDIGTKWSLSRKSCDEQK